MGATRKATEHRGPTLLEVFSLGFVLGGSLRHVFPPFRHFIATDCTSGASSPDQSDEIAFQADSRLVLELAKTRLQNQLSFADALDSKIATLFAAASALLGLLAAVFALQDGQVSITGGRLFATREGAILFAALISYGVATLAGTLAVWLRVWEVGPSVEDAFADAQLETDKTFIPKQISGYMHNWRSNRRFTRLKAWAVRFSFLAVLAQSGCVVAAIWTTVY